MHICHNRFEICISGATVKSFFMSEPSSGFVLAAHLHVIVCLALASRVASSESNEVSGECSIGEKCETVSEMSSRRGEHMAMDVLMFLGSVRQGRNAERVGRFIQRKLEEHGHRVKVLDPLELGLGQVEQPVHFYRNPADAPPLLHKLNKQIQEADAFVVVASEYNSAISPALCSLMDHFPPVSYAYRPSAIVTYSMGGFGGMRAAMQLREFLSELQTVHMPSLVTISKVHENLSEDGTLQGEATKILPQAVDKMIDELEWYARIMKAGRKAGTPGTLSS